MTYLSDLPELGLASDWLMLFGSDQSDGSDEDTSGPLLDSGTQLAVINHK